MKDFTVRVVRGGVRDFSLPNKREAQAFVQKTVNELSADKSKSKPQVRRFGRLYVIDGGLG